MPKTLQISRCRVLLTGEVIVTASVLSLLGGLGSYLHGAREGRFARSWINALTEIVLALVVGLCVMYLGVWQGWPQALTSVVILVLSNNGGDTLAMFKRWIDRYVTNRIKPDGDKENG